MTGQLALAGFVVPSLGARRRWRTKCSWVQLPLAVLGRPLVEWGPPPLAKVIPLPVKPRPTPAPPLVARDLFAEWEARLSAEGMPAELVNDHERAKDPARLDYLAAPGGGTRP